MDDTSMLSINHWYDRFFKIISIISFFLIFIVLTVMLRVGPASSYEFSIYDAYPWYFWVFILSAITCGQIVIIGSLFTPTKKNYWLFGLGAILISNALLLFLPIIRGYYIYGSGDVLTHIGYMKDILQTSSIGSNHYPIDHIIGVIIHAISGLSLPNITLIIPPIFSFFFILALYLVGKTIFQNKFELLILIIFSSILIWGIEELAFTPNSQAFMLVPLILYLAFKMYHGVNNIKYNILLLLMSFLIVFYHPLVTIIIILILCLMQITQYILEKYEKGFVKKVNYTYTIFFILIVFSTWSSYLELSIKIVEPIIVRIFGNAKIESELQYSVGLFSKVNADPIYLFKLIMNIYGQWILLGILSILSIVLIFISVKNQKTKLNFYMGISVMIFIGFSMLSIAMLFSNGQFNFSRIYTPATIFSLLLIPSGIYLFFNNNPNEKHFARNKIIKLLGVIFIIFCVTYFSIFNLYYSPIVKFANLQVPKSNYNGMNNFFTYRDESLPVLELGLSSLRYNDALYGQSAEKLNIYYFSEGDKMIPPDHFGYQNQTLSRNFYNNSKYLLLTDQGRRFYPHVYPEFESNWRFLNKDFERLKLDPNIQQVYSNRDLEIFLLS